MNIVVPKTWASFNGSSRDLVMECVRLTLDNSAITMVFVGDVKIDGIYRFLILGGRRIKIKPHEEYQAFSGDTLTFTYKGKITFDDDNL